MYIPSALAFGRDLIFAQRPNSHMYDTPSIAKDMLRSIRDNHRDILEQEKQEYDSTKIGVENSSMGTTLMDLCEIGISAQPPVNQLIILIILINLFYNGQLTYLNRAT